MFSDIIRVDPYKCFLLPEYISLKDAATLFVNYLTAYFSLFEIGNLKVKQTVLIKSCVGKLFNVILCVNSNAPTESFLNRHVALIILPKIFGNIAINISMIYLFILLI